MAHDKGGIIQKTATGLLISDGQSTFNFPTASLGQFKSIGSTVLRNSRSGSGSDRCFDIADSNVHGWFVRADSTVDIRFSFGSADAREMLIVITHEALKRLLDSI